MVHETPLEGIRHQRAAAAREDDVTKVELHAAFARRLMDQVEQVIQLLHEVQESDDLWPVSRVEKDDQVLASDGVPGEIGQQRNPLVQEAVGTDQPVQRLEDVADLLEDRTREVGDEGSE